MRIILFRGKRIDDGEWEYGGCVFTENKVCLIYNQTHSIDLQGCTVEENSVGQYTGLTDKNGEKIFEGDIVKLFDIHVGEIVQECSAFGIGCRQQIDYDYLASEIASVTGYDNTPMFCYNDNFVSLWELYWNYNDENDEISVIEVIGNIHDNPELLEVSNEY